jgi:Zn-dependent M28 family amino/carboxypeptidase
MLMHRKYMRAARACTMLSATALAFSPFALQAQAAPACPAMAIDSSGMMRDVFRLADDSMRGRRVGTPEGAKARDFIAARFDALGLDRIPPGRIHPFVTAGGSGAAINGFNVVGTVAGTRFPDQYIVVSAHFDHIGSVDPGAQCRASGADSICNGADDNASGTSGLLALATLFARAKPQHTLVFVAFDGEESGDVGSRAWVAAAPIPLKQVLVDVNMDMVGRNAKNQLFVAGPTKYPQLRSLVEAAIGCTTITLTIGHDGPGAPGGNDDWTNQSDQGAFNAAGIPFVYFGEEDHPDYHRATDHADRLMPAFYAAAVRAVGDFIRRFDQAAVPRQ